jgi:hypothetical protein
MINLFKLHFPQKISFVQLYTSASDCKDVGNFAGSHFESLSVAFLNMLATSRKRRLSIAAFSRGNR